MVYPCYCSRARRLAASAPHLGDGRRTYDGRCRRLSEAERKKLEAAGRRPAWRVQVPEREISFTDGHYGSVTEQLAEETGDLILRRSDGVYAYQLAVTADDGAMGITRVVRGRDLLSSTPGQLWLMEELGYPEPSYIHLPLLAARGRKLSKRDGDLNMETLRGRFTPRELTGLLAYLAGLISSPVSVSPGELIAGFSWDKVPRDDIVLPPELI
ncbi:Glutamyl-Q tRNA(Asp) synthetase [bioreactor metagenome]|uniref:Glutamyl-Q tRNA(Asp) synthetase n=1 Tax=bioreactor metagenome TaxID=1076179 RepID=A0A645BB29_9ZZZZ